MKVCDASTITPVRKRATAGARAVRHGRVASVSTARPDKTCARKMEARACKASVCDLRFSDARLQEAGLERTWRIATLLDHHDGDDDDLISSTRNDALPRAGFANLGNTCFIANIAMTSLGSFSFYHWLLKPRDTTRPT